MSETNMNEGQGHLIEHPLVLDATNPLFAGLSPEQQKLFLQFDAERQVIQREIETLTHTGKLPCAHGTSSNYLESILEHGLGGVTPVGALKKSKSTTDAAITGGMLGAYLFAKGLKENMLAIQRQQVDPEGDALKRYTQLSPAIPEQRLREQIESYFRMRAQVVGPEYEAAYPVLLIMTTEDSQQQRATNPNVPSERVFEGIFGKEQIAMICVPDQNRADAQEIIDKQGLTIQARAIEPLELF